MRAICSISNNDMIGINNQLIYHITKDLKWFKHHTQHNTIVMGWKTWESLPNPLPNRQHIILSNDEDKIRKYNTTVNFKKHYSLSFVTLEQYLTIQKESDWVIGGSQIFSLLEPYITEWFVTRVYHYPLIAETDEAVYANIPWNHLQLAAHTDIIRSKVKIMQDPQLLSYRFEIWHRKM